MNPRLRRTLRAFPLLVHSQVLRLLRERLVLRSLVWPTAVTTGTLAVTLLFFALLTGQRVVAATPTALANPAISAAISGAGWSLRADPDPGAAVAGWHARAGTDGHTLWLAGNGRDERILEAALRDAVGATWRPDRPELPTPDGGGAIVCRMIGVLFALYGVVFGLGSVARDRDDGALDAELALPLPRWLPPGTRLVSGALVLCGFWSVVVVTWTALLGIPDPWAWMRHGAAAASAGVALGIGAVGRAGLKQGFSGPLALALSLATAMLAARAVSPGLAAALPIASLTVGGDGWLPLGVAALTGAAATAFAAFQLGRG